MKLAFIGGLQFAKDGKLTAARILELKALIGTDFYAVTAANLTTVRDALATTYGFESIKEQL